MLAIGSHYQSHIHYGYRYAYDISYMIW